MWTEELEMALHAIALDIPEQYDVDIMDIEGLCLSYEDDHFCNDTVPGAQSMNEWEV